MFDCLPRVCSILQHNTTQPNILQYNRYEGILNKLICETAVQNVYAAYEKKKYLSEKIPIINGDRTHDLCNAGADQLLALIFSRIEHNLPDYI